MTKKTIVAISFIFMLLGVVAGFLISPAKNGMKFGGNEIENNYYNYKKDSL